MAMDDPTEENITDYISAAEVGNIAFVRDWIRMGRDPDEQKEGSCPLLCLSLTLAPLLSSIYLIALR